MTSAEGPPAIPTTTMTASVDDRIGYDAEWLEWEASAPMPPRPAFLDEEARATFDDGLIQLSSLLPPTDPGIKTRDEQIFPEVKVRIYHPPDSDRGILPVLLFCHGGGWIAGNLDTEDHICRAICGNVECIVVSVGYRSPLDAKFPASIEDCYRAFQWAYDNASALGANTRKFALWGGSAGASLAIAVAHQLTAQGQGDRLAGVIVMAGMFIHPEAVPSRYRTLHTSYADNWGDVPVVSGDIMRLTYQTFIGEEHFGDVEWFPVAGAPGSLRGFPKTYIVNSDLEACRDDGAVLEAALRDKGVEVKRDIVRALPHYFWIFPLDKAGRAFREMLAEGIRWVFTQS